MIHLHWQWNCSNPLVLVVLFFKDEDGNPLETEYGESSYKDHQTFTIQVALICSVDLVDVILVRKCVIKFAFILLPHSSQVEIHSPSGKGEQLQIFSY